MRSATASPPPSSTRSAARPSTPPAGSPRVRRLVAPDAAALGCDAALAHLDTVLAGGTSADRQVAIYRAARDAGRQRLTAVKEVIDWAAAETRAPAR